MSIALVFSGPALAVIGELLTDGLNLAGVIPVLKLEAENADLRSEIDDQP